MRSFTAKSQFAIWVALGAFVFYLSLVLFGWPQAAYRSALILSCHLAEFYICYSWLVPRYFERKKYFLTFLLFGLLLALLTSIRIGSDGFFVPLPNMALPSMSVRGKIGFILFSEIGVGSLAALLRLASTSEQNQKRLEALERERLQAELRFLKSQMSPHFLFNTINNIYSLTLVKSDKAPEALMKLSGLLRYLLYECHGKVSIRREVEALHAYAELFQLKYEKPLNLQIFVPDGLPDRTLEPLLLIPILENATKHSGLGFQPEAFVHLKLMWSDHLLTCVVRNSKSKNTEDSSASGIGLSNIKKRLQLISPGEDRLLIDDNESAFCITLNLSLS